jgi:carbamate kinase
MRIVIALGGNVMLRHSDRVTTGVQRRNLRIAAEALAPLVPEHNIVIVHGNGPQIGSLSLQPDSYSGAEPYPLDVLDAGNQGMIGCLIQQELRDLLPPEQQVVTLLTMTVVDPRDPAFSNPATVVGPVYPKETAEALAAKKGWTFRNVGAAWRRVVPSPEPRNILEIQPITWLLDRGAVVICAGGGGIPMMRRAPVSGGVVGVEAVIDKDLASELVAEGVEADLFVMATDVDSVYVNWATAQARRLAWVIPEELASYNFAAESMGPKAQAAASFARKTGRRAVIGSLDNITGMVEGKSGTNVIAWNSASERAEPGEGLTAGPARTGFTQAG